MKAALPLCWPLLAVPFAAAGTAVVLLAAWALLVAFGFDRGLVSLQVPLADSFPVTHPASPRVSVAWTHRRPVLHPAPAEPSADEQLAASADLLDFVERIRRHPVPGGYYLALKAYDFCTREARPTLDAMGDDYDGSGSPPDGRQRDAQETLLRLCGSFHDHNLAAINYYLLAEEGLQEQDSRLMIARRLERLSGQWNTASRDDGPSRQTLIAEVLTGQDGRLIRDLADEFAVILHSGYLMISGQPVDAAESRDVLDALSIMACEYGAPCTRDGEWRQLLACASAGECAPDPPTAGGNALRWRNRIREALLAGPGGIDIVPAAEQRY